MTVKLILSVTEFIALWTLHQDAPVPVCVDRFRDPFPLFDRGPEPATDAL